MTKRDVTKIFTDETCNKVPMRNYPTNKLIYNLTDEIWSIDLADFLDYSTSNNKGFRYIFVFFVNFSKYLWCIPLTKNSQTITGKLSNILNSSKRRPLETESDRGADWYNSLFQNFLEAKGIQDYSRFTAKGPSIGERVIRSLRNLMKKPVFLKGTANWLSELPPVIKK